MLYFYPWMKRSPKELATPHKLRNYFNIEYRMAAYYYVIPTKIFRREWMKFTLAVTLMVGTFILIIDVMIYSVSAGLKVLVFVSPFILILLIAFNIKYVSKVDKKLMSLYTKYYSEYLEKKKREEKLPPHEWYWKS